MRKSAPNLETLLTLAANQLFEEASVDCDEVGDDTDQPHQSADDHQNNGENQRLDVSCRRASAKVKDEEPNQQRGSKAHRNRSEKQKDPQRVVEDHDARDAREGAQDVSGIAVKKSW